MDTKSKNVLRKIKRLKPKTRSEVTFPMEELFDGSFRRGFWIPDTDLVIKFPYEDKDLENGEGSGLENGIIHTQREFKKIKKLSRFKCLRQHLPKIYYYDAKNGVIVMKYYNRIGEERELWELRGLLSTVILELTGVEIDDIVGSNVKTDEQRNLIFVDLGL